MQSLNFAVSVGGAALILCPGTGIWYESGTSTTSNTYIVAKPNGGGTEVTLKPGQHFQDAQNPAQQWTVTALDPTAGITGRLVIGNGDFGDSNGQFTMGGTGNVNVANLPAAPVPIAAGTGVTLPVSIAGTLPVSMAAGVAVSNLPAAPVPIAAGTGVTLPVSIAATVTTTQAPMTYTNSFESFGIMAGAQNIVTAASNVNGAILNQTLVSTTATSIANTFAFLAKATAPTSLTDGDVLDVISVAATTVNNFQNQSPIKVAAGKGIWMYPYTTTTASNVLISALATVL
jgi:hypothetical protein